ncbi:DsbE family thiol:disulfide interchange protein [Sphingomonas sp. 1P06PA]|uniref:DsbE family thiol:disulfide interchange protein n=1 Tax=Sphingomonas sp. 1P06PA TaxID=554121 RepID=UPI0039A5C2C4
MSRVALWLPLSLFALFAVVVGIGLTRQDGRTIPSKMIGQPIPAFDLPPAQEGRPGLASTDLVGQPRLVNIFASWCLPCRVEAPQLEQLKLAGVRIEGVAIRDQPQDVARFLAQYGDPYDRIGSDRDSSVQFALGSAGVPETFIVDGRGIVRYQHVGEIRPEHLPMLLQKLADAK